MRNERVWWRFNENAIIRIYRRYRILYILYTHLNRNKQRAQRPHTRRFILDFHWHRFDGDEKYYVSAKTPLCISIHTYS